MNAASGEDLLRSQMSFDDAQISSSEEFEEFSDIESSDDEKEHEDYEDI